MNLLRSLHVREGKYHFFYRK